MYCVKYFVLILILKLDSCKPDFSLRSVGGRDAHRSEFPFIISLNIRIKKTVIPFCTGSVLTPTWGITAAHCKLAFHKKKFKVVTRWYNPSYEDQTGESEIISFIIHPGHPNIYKLLKHTDIALIETEQNMDVIKFAKLSSLDYKSVMGFRAFAVGYGLRNVTENIRTLQAVEGMLSRCGITARKRLRNLICLMPKCSARWGRVSSTPGDSGGPVVHTSGIVGIAVQVTMPIDTNRKHLKPNVHEFPICMANTVSPYLNWISKVVTLNNTNK